MNSKKRFKRSPSANQNTGNPIFVKRSPSYFLKFDAGNQSNLSFNEDTYKQRKLQVFLQHDEPIQKKNRNEIQKRQSSHPNLKEMKLYKSSEKQRRQLQLFNQSQDLLLQSKQTYERIKNQQQIKHLEQLNDEKSLFIEKLQNIIQELKVSQSNKQQQILQQSRPQSSRLSKLQSKIKEFGCSNEEIMSQLQLEKNKKEMLKAKVQEYAQYTQKLEDKITKLEQNDGESEIQKQLDKTQKELIQLYRDHLELEKKMKALELTNQAQASEIENLKKLRTVESSSYKKLNDLYNHSMYANSQLREEQKKIQKMLQAVNIDDVEERSDLISQIKSQKVKSGSPVRITKKNTVQSSQIVEVIPEHKEDSIEDINQEINQDIQQRERRKSLRQIGKALSSGPKQGFHFLDKGKKQKTEKDLQQEGQTMMDLVNQQVANETFADDKLSQFVCIQSAMPPKVQSVTQSEQELKYVKKNDPHVQIGLERLARLQQVKRMIMEQVEKLLFGDKYHINRMISLIDLSTVFVKSLDLVHNQAVVFARYLVEGTPEEGQSDVVQFDPIKKIDLQTVIVRLMSNSSFPLIYSDEEENQARDKFTIALKGKQQQFIRAISLIAKESKLISFEQFCFTVKQMTGSLSHKDIDCLFVFLCRGAIPFEQVDQLSQTQLKQSLQGFRSELTQKIFSELVISEENTNNSSDYNKMQQPGLLKFPLGDENSVGSSAKKYKVEETPQPVTPVLGGFYEHKQSFSEEAKVTSIKDVAKKQWSLIGASKYRDPNQNKMLKNTFSFIQTNQPEISEKKPVEEIEEQEEEIKEEMKEGIKEEINEEIKDDNKDEIKEENFAAKYSETRSDIDLDMMQSMGPNMVQPMMVQPSFNKSEKNLLFLQQDSELDIIAPGLNKTKTSKFYQPTMIEEIQQDSQLSEIIKTPKKEQYDNDEDKYLNFDVSSNNIKDEAPDQELPLSISVLNSPGGQINDFIHTSISPKSDSFMPDQQEALRSVVNSLLTSKIEQDGAKLDSIDRVLDHSVGVFLQVATKFKHKTLREIFYKQLLVIQENALPDQDAVEIEVLKPESLIDIFQSESEDQSEINPLQKRCILLILQNPSLKELISYEEVCKIFNTLGLKEGKPKNQVSLNYENLSLQAMRIINRLIAHLDSTQMDLISLFEDIIVQQAIKTKQQNQQIEVIMARDFFEKINESFCLNLCEFLCVDLKYKKYLMVKKLKKCILDFAQNPYYQQIGLKSEYH